MRAQLSVIQRNLIGLKKQETIDTLKSECDFWSLNMRLDTLQAAYLNEKIKKLKKINYRRNENAKLILENYLN